MGLKRTEEFRQDAVRIALTSGLTRKQVADDLGVHCPAGDCAAICREGPRGSGDAPERYICCQNTQA